VARVRAASSLGDFVDTLDRDKGSLSRNEPPARQIARRLIESHRSERTDGQTAARAAAAACDQLYRELSRWVGPDGCHALFTRALAQARTEYPALGQIQLHARSEPYIDGVAETIMAHGDHATAEGLEAMLVHLIELLGRLIGDDMAMKLIERSLAASELGGETSDSRREEA
jgi:hypothetical protein